MAGGGLGQCVQQNLGLPPGLKFFSPYPFGGMNTQAGPTSIADSEFLWIENFIRLGDGNFRTAWDRGSSIYTTPIGKTIVMHYFYTIGTSYYAAVFLSDGSAIQINTTTFATTTIGGAGTFYNGGDLPACAQWGTLYLLISNRNTFNDYWAWDGAQLYHAGTAAPRGVNLLSGGSKYTSAPTVTPFGGNGTGLAVTATVNAGSVVDLHITNPGSGYQVGDIVQLAFSGGGSDTSARLVANLAAGSVAAVSVTAPGSGYTTASVGFSGGGGSGAAATAQIGSGVSSITVTAGGTGYTTAPAITFTGGGGTGAAATAIITGGIVTSITVDSTGTGYTSAPTVNINGGGGTGATATATIQNGIITGVTITNGGTGYTSAPSVAISGDGSGATGNAVLNPASLQSVTVVNGGSGFIYAPPISFVGGGGTGAAGIVQLTGTSIAKINVVSAGANYQTAPTVKISGGGGGGFGGSNGATATAVIAQGQVVAINVTNGGSGFTEQPLIFLEPHDYGKSTQDTGSGATAQAVLSPTSISGVQISNYGNQYTDAPTIEITPGANNSAYATVDLMPFGVSGGALETYQQRVWIVDPAPAQFGDIPPGGNFSVSAPGSFIDFATSDGGVDFTNSDGFLQTKYVGVRQSNGYLYMFGDGSISIISSVQTSGSPSTTTFNYQNVDPQTGMSFRDSRQDFGKTILFANETGVYGLYGGSATLASAKMLDVFNNAIFPPTGGALLPTAASATIFDLRHYLLLMTVKDPATLQYRNVMLTWNEREWSITSQTTSLTYIAMQKISSKLYAWGTDGTNLFPLFATPSASLIKRLDTKVYGGSGMQMLTIKAMTYLHMQGQDKSAGASGIDCTVDLIASGLTPQPADGSLSSTPNDTLINPWFVSVNFPAPYPYWPLFGTKTGGIPFTTLGARLKTFSPDFVMANFALGYTDEMAHVG